MTPSSADVAAAVAHFASAVAAELHRRQRYRPPRLAAAAAAAALVP